MAYLTTCFLSIPEKREVYVVPLTLAKRTIAKNGSSDWCHCAPDIPQETKVRHRCQGGGWSMVIAAIEMTFSKCGIDFPCSKGRLTLRTLTYQSPSYACLD